MSRTPPKSGVPSPFYYNPEWERYGLHGSLKHYAWEALQSHPQGLTSAELAARLQGKIIKEGGRGTSPEQVEQVLTVDPHFLATSEDSWTLAVFRPLKWGFAGAGLIAEDFAEALRMVPGAELHAVATRSAERLDQAQEFARMHGVKQAYGSYEELARDPEVQIVYVSNIHTGHEATSTLMMHHGKHVLCEKPAAMNARETKAMVHKAQQTGLFLAVGMWSRFFPSTQLVRELIQSGTLGEVHQFFGRMFFHMPEDLARMYKLELGGGALLDLGVYPISMASCVYGCQPASTVQAIGDLHKTGVDTLGCVNLKYGKGQLANASYGMVFPNQPAEAQVLGTQGAVTMHDAFHHSTKLTVKLKDQEKPWVLELPMPDRPHRVQHGKADGGWNYGGSIGFVYEAMAVHSHVVQGLKEIKDVSHRETVQIMETLDQVRQQVGLQYPQDDPNFLQAPESASGHSTHALQPSALQSLLQIVSHGPPERIWGASMLAMVVTASVLGLTLISWAAGRTAVPMACSIMTAIITVIAMICMAIIAVRK
jgi:dihydrodiol dehydrogenase / D-xylose 1-dehydrogenase (NADP)